jgi:glycosyltransferase involved in cell wall biosynthesis
MAGTEAEPARLVCELTDLLAYFATNRAPMGVARVQMALLEAALAPPALFEICAFDAASQTLRHVPREAFAALMAAARAGGPQDEPDWLAARAGMGEAFARAEPFAFSKGDVLFALGAAWWLPDQLRLWREWRSAHGLRLGFLFYDAIPLLVPEHCAEDLVRQFAEYVAAICLHADLVVAISRRSAEDFERLRRLVLLGVEIPVEVLGLDAPLPAVAGEPRLPPRERPYVLCVSTIESRKNQLLVLQAWLTLLRRHGEGAMPDLLLVGRQGFGAEPALRLLSAAPELRRRAVWLPDVGDADLACLYQGCLFAIFNSFYEGWGMPVTEALSQGRLVLAPDHSSLREAGGEAALYFEPQNEPDLAAQAWRLIRDAEWRTAREAAIAKGRPLRSWREIAESLQGMALRPRPVLPAPPHRAPLPLGHRLSFARGAEPEALGAPSLAAALVARGGEGWWEPEGWGVWLRPGRASISLFLAEPAPVPLLLLLDIRAPHGRAMRARLRLRPPGAAPEPWRSLAHEGELPACFAIPVGPCAAGEFAIEWEITEGVTQPGDPRPLGPGLAGLTLCAFDDVPARLRHAGAGSLSEVSRCLVPAFGGADFC